MDHILLNKIIIDISDSEYKSTFINNADASVASKLLAYSEGLYHFADSLYITDTVQGLNKFCGRGYPTAAFCHPHNSGEDFGNARYIIEQPEMISLRDYDNIFRRLYGYPLDILETDRLIIRETVVSDTDRFYALYDDPMVASFMEPLFPPDEEREYQQSYIDNVYGFSDIGIWTVILKETDEIIGRIGIEYTDDEGCLELGFMIGAPYRRRDLAYEACTAIIEYARAIENADRIRARVRQDNDASKGLCAKLGLTPVKELPENLTEWSLTLKD